YDGRGAGYARPARSECGAGSRECGGGCGAGARRLRGVQPALRVAVRAAGLRGTAPRRLQRAACRVRGTAADSARDPARGGISERSPRPPRRRRDGRVSVGLGTESTGGTTAATTEALAGPISARSGKG